MSEFLKEIFATLGARVPEYPTLHDGQLWYIQQLDGEKNNRLIRYDLSTNTLLRITDSEHSIATRVHEYGGHCWCLSHDAVYYNDAKSGQIFRQSLVHQEKSEALTPYLIDEKKVIGYADLSLTPDGCWLIAVAELEHTTNCNILIALDLSHAQDNREGFLPIHILSDSADFYAAPVCSASNDIAWLEWSMDNMPWDRTCLRMGQLKLAQNNLPMIDDIRDIVTGRDACISQIGFMPDVGLVFAADGQGFGNFANLYAYSDREIKPITDTALEFGDCHWQFGQHRWQALGSHDILAVVTEKGREKLARIRVKTGTVEILWQAARIYHLSGDSKRVVFVAEFADARPCVMLCDMNTHQVRPFIDKANYDVEAMRDQKRMQGLVYEPVAWSIVPDYIEFPTQHDKGYLYFYKPDHDAQAKPPAVIMAHGGPTGRTDDALHPVRQFFVHSGFAVVDINYHGSSGYGREYRDALYGQWGELEVANIIDAIQYLSQHHYIDANRVFIRGSSAGGYSVLQALVKHGEVFAAAASYYGIGNLLMLAELTHKFEASYTDRLIGEAYDKEASQLPQSRFITRSPIFHMDHLRTPIIIFQGAKDAVVPVALANELVAMLKSKQVPFEYVEYPEEGHGFRDQANKYDALQKEVAFYRQFNPSRA